MKKALAGHGNRTFDAPEGITWVEIDRDTGKLATPGCPRTMSESFISGTEPTEYCELHRVNLSSHFWLLAARFVFRFGSGFGVRGSGFGTRLSPTTSIYPCSDPTVGGLRLPISSIGPTTASMGPSTVLWSATGSGAGVIPWFESSLSWPSSGSSPD